MWEKSPIKRQIHELSLWSFDFSNVKNLRSTFALTGRDNANFYIDFSGFDFTNFVITDYGITFSGWKSTQKIYVMNEGSKNWFINKGWTNINSNNVFIKDENSNIVGSFDDVNNDVVENESVHYYALG